MFTIQKIVISKLPENMDALKSHRHIRCVHISTVRLIKYFSLYKHGMCKLRYQYITEYYKNYIQLYKKILQQSSNINDHK